MIIADCHNDTATRLYFERQGLFENDFNIGIKKQGSHKTLLFFSVFCDFEKYGNDPKGYFLKIYKNLKNELEKNASFVCPYKNKEDFLRGKKSNYVITLEGADFVNDISHIDFLSALNIKSVTLTWNKSNEIACCHLEKDDYGLTKLGKRVIEKMEEKSIIPDLSHASDRTFYEAVEIAKKPVLVSHSNSRKLCPHSRNLTDDMFLGLMKNKGVCGINFYRDFVGKNGTIDSLCNHIFHFLSLGGEDNLAFGSDFDGANPLVRGINSIADFYKIPNRLLQLNLSESILKKIMYENVLRILEAYGEK